MNGQAYDSLFKINLGHENLILHELSDFLVLFISRFSGHFSTKTVFQLPN